MKFLCDSCKAKYQIADEKVAGKTVRMKCRKCGHQIEVRAAVTETSVANAPPKSPSIGAPAASPRPPQKSGLATSLSATKPRASSPSRPPGSALGAAFQRNVSDAPASVAGQTASASIELSVTDEWYVAINGVPVGPVRISELRRKAAAGAVTEESLCWQEGLEEWRPIKSIPDLATLVREAASGNRPSLIADAPPARSPSVPSAPQHGGRPQRNSAPPPRPVSTPSAPHAAARSNVVPLRPAASSGIDDIGFSANGTAAMLAPSPSFAPPAPVAQVADPFAIPPPPPAPMMAPLTPANAGMPFRDSGFAPSLAPPPVASTDQGRKGGVPLWFWPILLLALGFGGAFAFLLFRQQPQQAPVVIQMPPTAAAAPTNAAPVNLGDVPSPPSSSDTPTTAPDPKKPAAVAAKGGSGAKPAPEEKKGLDLGGLAGGAGGPNVGPGGGPSPNGAAGLNQAGVERVVAMHRNGVKRTCWERAGQASSANVTVVATVAPNGTVTGTSSTGDDPVVAKCIESQVKTWQFSAPGQQTTLNIPFKFVKQ